MSAATFPFDIELLNHRCPPGKLSGRLQKEKDRYLLIYHNKDQSVIKRSPPKRPEKPSAEPSLTGFLADVYPPALKNGLPSYQIRFAKGKPTASIHRLPNPQSFADDTCLPKALESLIPEFIDQTIVQLQTSPDQLPQIASHTEGVLASFGLLLPKIEAFREITEINQLIQLLYSLRESTSQHRFELAAAALLQFRH